MPQLTEGELGVLLNAGNGLSTSAQKASKDALQRVRMQVVVYVAPREQS